MTLRLTADGQTLMDAVVISLGHISAEAREIRQQPSVGRLTVGMISSLASLFVVRRIGEFLRNHPGLDVHVVSLERNLAKSPSAGIQHRDPGNPGHPPFGIETRCESAAGIQRDSGHPTTPE